MISKYVKKPVVVEAVKYTGQNKNEIQSFVGKELVQRLDGSLQIETLEGIMCANVGDYVIKGVSGEFYPCKPIIFNKTYDLVEQTEKQKI
jgi:hypothetical protein